jgi:hypothetical protein
MNQKDIQTAIDNATLVAWRPSDSWGLARVRAVETGIEGASHRRDMSRVQIVQATFDFSTEDPKGVLANNRQLSEWTQDTEHTFSVLNDREAFKSDTMQAAALAGIAVAGVDLVSQRVLLSGDEFQRVCQQISPPSETIAVEDAEDEDYRSSFPSQAKSAL